MTSDRHASLIRIVKERTRSRSNPVSRSLLPVSLEQTSDRYKKYKFSFFSWSQARSRKNLCSSSPPAL